jgi:YHS domain-containing protein
MDRLDEFQKQIQNRLIVAADAKRQCQQEREQQRIDLDRRIEEFRTVGDRVLAEIVRPRLAAIVERFDNAILSTNAESSAHLITCQFARCDRFPASTNLTISVSHDSAVESLVITFDLEILPVFVKFAGHDQKFFPLAELDEQEISTWLEAKLLEFVETYLSLERIPAYQHDNLVVDPVCGASITKNCSASHEQYAGREIYFCSEHCHRKFVAAPDSFNLRSR